MPSTTSNVVPLFGLGTYRLKGQVILNTVAHALEIGYRAIDTAQIYENEAEIGEAMQVSGVARDQIFLTTKIWTAHLAQDRVIPSLQESLRKLRTDYVDLALIHWPSPGQTVSLAETLEQLLLAKQRGLTRHIGVSNFTIALLRESVAIAGAGQIATNQIELSPYLQNRAVVDCARSLGISTTSYMTLAYGSIISDPLLGEISATRGATPAQVALAWAMQMGYSVIPSSTRRSNLESNFQARLLRLNDGEMKRIAGLERAGRLINPTALAPIWD